MWYIRLDQFVVHKIYISPNAIVKNYINKASTVHNIPQ